MKKIIPNSRKEKLEFSFEKIFNIIDQVALLDNRVEKIMGSIEPSSKIKNINFHSAKKQWEHFINKKPFGKNIMALEISVNARNYKSSQYLLGDIMDEMDHFSPVFKDIIFQKIFVGSDVCSLLSCRQIEELFAEIARSFNFGKSCQRSVFLGLTSITEEKIIILKKNGFNRINLKFDSPRDICANKKILTEAMNIIKMAGLTAGADVHFNLNLPSDDRGILRKAMIILMEAEIFRIGASFSYGQKELNDSFKKADELFSKRNAFMAKFLEQSRIISAHFGYLLADPWGNGGDYYQDHLNENNNYLVFIRNKKKSIDNLRCNHREFHPFTRLCLGMGSNSQLFGDAHIMRRHVFSKSRKIYELVEVTLMREIKEYVVKVLDDSGKISLSAFKEIFGLDFLTMFKIPTSFLIENGKAEVRKDYFFLKTSQKREILAGALLIIIQEL